MAYQPFSQQVSVAIADGITAETASVKADASALVSPGDGGQLVALFDRTNALQRHMECNQNGAVIIGNTAGDAVTGNFDSTLQSETAIALYVRAALSGHDGSQAAGSQNNPIEARGALTAQAYSLVRLFSDSVVRGDDGATYSAIATRAALAAQAYALNRLLGDSVIRGDDGTTFSVPAVRTPNNLSGGVLTLLGLNVNALGYFTEAIASVQENALGLREITTVNRDLGGVLEARARGYWASRRGRRYVCKSPNLTGVAAATSLTLTAPTFLLVTGATNEVVVRRITISMPLKGTSTTFTALVKTDNVNRFSAGGTARAPGTLNQGNTIGTGLAQNLEAPTATAESTAIDVAAKTGSVADGAVIEFLFEDGLVIQSTGSLLLYVVTATAGATVNYEIEFEEANVQ